MSNWPHFLAILEINPSLVKNGANYNWDVSNLYSFGHLALAPSDVLNPCIQLFEKKDRIQNGVDDLFLINCS